MSSTTFNRGATYQTRSVGDHDCKVTVTIESRTKCFVRTTDGEKFRVFLRDGIERIKPWGSFSMAPTLSADREISK